jgi:hypothetical protein
MELCTKRGFSHGYAYSSTPVVSHLTLMFLQENVYFVIYVLMSTFFFYLTILLVPVIALFGDFLYLS